LNVRKSRQFYPANKTSGATAFCEIPDCAFTRQPDNRLEKHKDNRALTARCKFAMMTMGDGNGITCEIIRSNFMTSSACAVTER
jgi:hypothetical protein